MVYGPKRLFLLRYESRDTRHIDFPRVDGLSTDPRVLGRHNTVESSSSPNSNDSTKRLNNFDLRLQALSQDLNDSLVSITRHHDANKAQFDLITASVSNLNLMCSQLTQRQYVLK